MSAAVFGDVTSANVVGYLTSGDAAPAGYKLYVPTFNSVGKEITSIADIVPVAITGTVPNGENAKAAITFQRLKADGGTNGQKLYWKDYQFDDDGDLITYGPGWCTATGEKPAKVDLKAGEGIFITYPKDCACTLQFAGEVNEEDTYVILNKGYTLTGNNTPVEIDLKNILPVAEEGFEVPTGEVTKNAITFQKLKADGGTSGQKLYWKNYEFDDDGDLITYGPGWCTAAGEKGQSVKIAPGEGIFITCNDANAIHYSLKIPGVKVSK